ncbi:hypothetical protein FK178_08155 [Antarcticibacterium arcticum]|uniref:Putative beta-lactamase-inhibitor-like PepSY-like domain-containing protein n=1 Tax=Antarcticibacterium arcticum TaxID=2585771 RepID=A0A5B8YN68_9FLAO|nr:PepSY-like domain-containing protein [Antarcticibacterium arcticum]QED37696.1 hypothetical protein FK178_08155 [Antarcticibacterium arcticum]
MKKVILSTCIALFSLGLVAQTNTTNLPSKAQDFIKQNFASLSVSEVKENSNWKIWEDDKYEVTLSNGIELDFNENGEIIEIDSKNNEAISLSVLPTNISSYLKENYPDAQVIGWEKQKNEQEVELADGTELEFDELGKFRRID